MNDHAVIKRVKERLIEAVDRQQEKGLRKYGKPVNPDELSIDEWMDHLEQELIGGLVYLGCIRAKGQRLIQTQGEISRFNQLLSWYESRIDELTKMIALLVEKCGGKVELLQSDLELMITDALTYVTVNHTPDGKVVLTTRWGKDE